MWLVSNLKVRLKWGEEGRQSPLHAFNPEKGVVMVKGKWSCSAGRQSLYSDNIERCLEQYREAVRSEGFHFM